MKVSQKNEIEKPLLGWARIRQIVKETGRGATIDQSVLADSLSAIESAKEDPTHESACEVVKARRLIKLYNNLRPTDQLAVLNGTMRLHIDYTGNVIARHIPYPLSPTSEKK